MVPSLEGPVSPHLKLRHILMVLILTTAMMLFGVADQTARNGETPCKEELRNALYGVRVSGRLSVEQAQDDRSKKTDGREIRRALNCVDRLRNANPNSMDVTRIAIIKIIQHKWDDAVVLLESASRSTTDWAIYNDLAVTYMARAEEGKPYDFVRALENIDSALSVKPNSAIVLFNRASILESIHCEHEAIAAWGRYIESESVSAWRASGVTRRNRLIARLGRASETFVDLKKVAVGEQIRSAHKFVAMSSQKTRLHVEDELLPAWANLELEEKKEGEADLTLSAASSLSKALSRSSGDKLLDDGITMIMGHTEHDRERIARGVLAYSRGRALLKSRKTAEAEELFLDALNNLQGVNSPIALWVHFSNATAGYLDKDYGAALGDIARVRKKLNGRKYLNLLGRVDWLEGLIYLERSEPGSALPLFSKSIQAFRTTKELGNLAAVLSLKAHAYELLGEVTEAWLVREEALKIGSRFGDKDRFSVILSEAIRAALDEGHYSVALALQGEAIQLDMESLNPIAIAESCWRRARIYDQAGASQRALADLNRAREFCAKINHDPTRLQITAGILATEGSVLSKADQVRAIKLLDESLAIYHGLSFDFLHSKILLDRARCYRARGNLGAATADLDDSLVRTERLCLGAEGMRLTASCFSQARQVFLENMLLNLEAHTGVGNAFAALERGRSRWLFKAYGGSRPDSRHPDVARLVGQLPQNIVVVEFAVLPGETYAWILSRRSGIRLKRISNGEQRIKEMVSDFLRTVQSSPDPLQPRSFGEMAASLFDQLFGEEMGDLLEAADTLVIIPDGPLSSLPFAALLNTATGRFLAEDYRIVVAPSLGVYLYLNEIARGRIQIESASTALVVGNPAFDRVRYAYLSNLSKAEIEATDVVKLLPGSDLLIGREATKSNFAASLMKGDHSIVHFAGHAVVPQLVV